MNTIDALPNEFDLDGFLHFFLPNMKIDLPSQSILSTDKAFED
jgi:hypothetical protein